MASNHRLNILNQSLILGLLLSFSGYSNIALSQTISIEATPTYVNGSHPGTRAISLPILSISAESANIEGAFRMIAPAGVVFTSAIDTTSSSTLSFPQTAGTSNILEVETVAPSRIISLRIAVRIEESFTGALTFQVRNGNADSLNPIGLPETSINFGQIIAADTYQDDHGAIELTATSLGLNESIGGVLIANDTDAFLLNLLEPGSLTLQMSQLNSVEFALRGPDRCSKSLSVSVSDLTTTIQTTTLLPGKYLFQTGGGLATGNYILSNKFTPAPVTGAPPLLSEEPLKFGYIVTSHSQGPLFIGSIKVDLDANSTPSGIFRLVAPEGVSFTGFSAFTGSRIPVTLTEVISSPVLARIDSDNNGSTETLDIRPLCLQTEIFPNVTIEENFSGELIMEVIDGGALGTPETGIANINQKRSFGRVLTQAETTQNIPTSNNANLAIFDLSTSILHTPVLLLGNEVFWVDLIYLGRGKFSVAGFAPTVASSLAYASFESAGGILRIPHVSIFADGQLSLENFDLVMSLDTDGSEFQIVSIENRN